MNETSDKGEERQVTFDQFLLMFAPESWTAPRRLGLFLGPPYQVTRPLSRAVSAADNRIQKLYVLTRLANKLRGGLLLDLNELETEGYSPNWRSKEYAAVAETIFLELYSALDAIRATLFYALPGVRGIQNRSTERLFRRAHEQAYGAGFPEAIRTRLASAFDTWFPGLHEIRTEITHGDIGKCYLRTENGPIIYMHNSLGERGKAFIVDDLEARLSGYSGDVAGLVNHIFSRLCSKLEPEPIRLPCGMYRGRMYERIVEYSHELTFDSGKCFSRRWFETDADTLCPMRLRCGAYAR